MRRTPGWCLPSLAPYRVSHELGSSFVSRLFACYLRAGAGSLCGFAPGEAEKKRDPTATGQTGHAMRMDPGEWAEMLNARLGAHGSQGERAPLGPDASEVERYVWEHSRHPGFRVIADVPQPGMALIRCKHIGEAGRDFPTPIAEATELCARYGVELIARDKWAPGRSTNEVR